MDLKKMKQKLNTLQTQGNNNSSKFWKPEYGEQIIRLVPYKHNLDNPFCELYLYYDLTRKTVLSPQTFNRPDPVVEFAEKLKSQGDTELWREGRKLEPKLRTYAPVLVRGEEDAGVRFYGFGKTVYQDLLGYIADPDYGDLSDPETGRDIVVTYISPEESGQSWPVTKVRVKPNVTPLHEDSKKVEKFLEDQVDISDLFEEPTYDELKEMLQGYLKGNDVTNSNDSDESEEEETPQPSNNKTKTKKTTKSSSESSDDSAPWEKEFEEMFD